MKFTLTENLTLNFAILKTTRLYNPSPHRAHHTTTLLPIFSCPSRKKISVATAINIGEVSHCSKGIYRGLQRLLSQSAAGLSDVEQGVIVHQQDK